MMFVQYLQLTRYLFQLGITVLLNPMPDSILIKIESQLTVNLPQSTRMRCNCFHEIKQALTVVEILFFKKQPTGLAIDVFHANPQLHQTSTSACRRHHEPRCCERAHQRPQLQLFGSPVCEALLCVGHLVQKMGHDRGGQFNI